MNEVQKEFELRILEKLEQDMISAHWSDLQLRGGSLTFDGSSETHACKHGVSRHHYLKIRLPSVSAHTLLEVTRLLIQYSNRDNYHVRIGDTTWMMAGELHFNNGTFTDRLVKM